jgi:hypothetical protein
MQKIPFLKKFITCLLAGLVAGAFLLRQGVTFFRQWVPIGTLTLIEFITVSVAVIYAFIWQARKKDNPGTLAFWQGLIRYGGAYDLASFGWEKICHLQLVVPGSWADRPYRSFPPSELFWSFFSHSYLFGCIIAGLQIIGAMLLLFRRTTLAGVFIILPILANILLMDIFYEIGQSVVVHSSIMMLGILYFLFLEFERLKAVFFSAKNSIASLQVSGYIKVAIRLSIIYLPLLLIAMHGSVDRHPALTGKYDVKHLKVNRNFLFPNDCADSILTVVYFDIKDGCVFEFNTPQRRWSGSYNVEDSNVTINWRDPKGKPDFKGLLSQDPVNKMLVLTGMLGADSTEIRLRKVTN